MTTRPLPLLPPTESPQPTGDEPGLGLLTCDQGWLPLTAVEIHGQVAGLGATVTVRQRYHNPFDHPIEATYIHPLPDRAAVVAFSMVIGDRRIEGELQERGQARHTYDQALDLGHRAAITEEDRPDVFTTRVGNLQPGDQAEVELRLVQPLPWADGQAELRLPLVVAPRYIPGQPLDGAPVGGGTALDTDAVPDASRISPPVLLAGLPNPVELAVEVDFGHQLPSGLCSSLHTVVEGDAAVSLRPGERLDRDLILRWPTNQDGAGAGHRAEPTVEAQAAPDDEGSAEGTFTVTILPPADEPGRQARRVAVVLDRSGSMGGWKMVAARRAAARIIDTLGPDDHFTLLGFDHQVERPSHLEQGLVAATDRNRWLAIEWLASLEARGGTELGQPLLTALDDLTPPTAGTDPEPTATCVLVTDGQVGNEDQILAELGARADQARLFTIGIDQAVNAGFLRRLAALGGGRCELVESDDRLDEVMRAIHRRIAAPVLESVTLTGNHSLEAVSPSGALDCFSGVPLVIRGRYRGQPPTITWTGQAADGSTMTGSTTPSEAPDPGARPLWARSRVRDLEDELAALAFVPRAPGSPDTNQMEAGIVALSLSTGVLSRFTAFVAVDRSVQVEGGTPLGVVQPVERPRGWAAPAGLVAGHGPVMARAQTMAAPMPAAAAPAGNPDWMAAPEAAALTAPGGGPGDKRLSEATTARGRRRRVPPRITARLAGRGDPAPEPGPGPVRLTPYRARIEELVARIDQGQRGWPVERDLDDLIGDLRSVEAPSELIEALERLLEEVQSGAEPAATTAQLTDLVERLLG